MKATLYLSLCLLSLGCGRDHYYESRRPEIPLPERMTLTPLPPSSAIYEGDSIKDPAALLKAYKDASQNLRILLQRDRLMTSMIEGWNKEARAANLRNGYTAVQ